MSQSAYKPSFASTQLIVALLVLMGLTVAGTALLGILLLLTYSDNERDFMLLANGMMAIGYLALALGAAYVIRAGRLVPLMVTALFFALLGFVAFTIMMWHERSMNYRAEIFMGGLGLTGTATTLALVHAGIFARLQTKVAVLAWARWVVVAVTSLAGGTLLAAFWSTYLELVVGPPMLLFGFFQLLVALAVLGTLIVPVAIRLAAKREAARAESLNRRKIVLTCPQCTVEQELSSGPCWCKQCGFTMIIEIQEPRCECGYLLFKLERDTCPECGRKMAHSGAAQLNGLSSEETQAGSALTARSADPGVHQEP